jgi:hypothetical protein
MITAAVNARATTARISIRLLESRAVVIHTPSPGICEVHAMASMVIECGRERASLFGDTK